MPQLIQPHKIVTRDGELTVHLTIDLNVNITNSGDVTVSAGAVKQKDKEDDPVWEVPTFGPAPKVKFGKTEDK